MKKLEEEKGIVIRFVVGYRCESSPARAGTYGYACMHSIHFYIPQ